MKQAWLVLMFVLISCGRAMAAPPGPCNLTFDASAGKWVPTTASCAGVRVDRDLNGVPTLFIDRDQEVAVTVININPLIYAGSIGDVTLTDIDQVKDVAALFLQFGGLLLHAPAGDKAIAPATVTLPPALTALEASIVAVESMLRTFQEEESALLGILQQMEFNSRAAMCVPWTTATLAQWSTALGTLRKAYDDIREPAVLKNVKNTAGAADPLDEAMKKADAILGKERDLMKTVAATKVIGERARTTPGAGPCSTATNAYLVPQVISLGKVTRDEWSKIATFPVTIARQSPYDDAIVGSLADEIKTKFRLTSRQASLLGIGVGLTSSNIVSPSWTAAADPKNPSQKVVTRSDEQSRVAIKSLIASYAFSESTATAAVRPLAEFGASLESDAPGAFGGIGFRIARYLRLGVGVTAQRVKALNGQVEGVTVVADNDAIKTKSAWKNGWYWSFGFSLTDLPLFSRD